ncbi:MAG: serine hydrolase domain-containing protein [Pseudomonadota bacterium]
MRLFQLASLGAMAFACAGFTQPAEEEEPLPTLQETVGDTIAIDDLRADELSVEELSLDELSIEPEEMLDDTLEAYIDGLLDVYQATYRVPGYVVSVVRTDETLLSKGYGLADVDQVLPVSPEETRWHIASISKTFVWTSIMMLHDRGLLDLDTDVNKYLKEYKVPEGEKPLTLNMIMAHRSGLEDGYDVFDDKIQDLPRAEAMALTEPKQVYDRGNIRAYSNWATNLAALIIDDVTGSYDDFLFTEILEPLKMTGTTLGPVGDAYEQLDAAKNYSVTPWGPEDDTQIDSRAFAPLGGMTITGADMATWMRFHLGRGAVGDVRLMSEETYALMRSRAYGENSVGADMAHGFSDWIFRGVRVYGHSGSINSVFSVFLVAPELDLGVFLAQGSHETYTPLSQIAPLVFERQMGFIGLEQEGILPGAPEGDAAVQAAEELAGKYVPSRRPHTDFEKFFGVFDSTEVSAKEGQIIFGNGGGGAYRPIAPDTWENAAGARLTVARDETGAVAGIQDSFGASMLLPQTFWTNGLTLIAPLGATCAFLVTTVLGIWRRLGRSDEVRGMGRLLSLLAFASIAPMGWFFYNLQGFDKLGNEPYAKLFLDYPPALASTMSLSASLITVVGAVMLLSLMPAWSSSGFSIWRKLHHSLLSLSYGALGIALIHWGLSFNSLVLG